MAVCDAPVFELQL